MDNELRYEAVNKCETLEELALVIESFSDELGMIQGRTRPFDALNMAKHCRVINPGNINALTRQWGIRQQAIYIMYYELLAKIPLVKTYVAKHTPKNAT